MTANGWTLRSGQGWPGVTGASFRAENVAFIDYPAQVGNRLLRMTSSTDGTSENTYQTQICHQRKYMEGIYAARVRFSDVPVTGSDGDQIVQTFYTITPYEKPSTLITAKWILNICLIVVGAVRQTRCCHNLGNCPDRTMECSQRTMPDEVNAKINELRNAAVKFQDTVSPGAIALASPCDL
jgi:hypothetical protein